MVCTIYGGVADVQLNRPEKLNALDFAMFTALAETAAAVAETPGVRAVVLSGAGRSFCAGLDLSAFSAMAQGEVWQGERWRPADDPTAIGADGRSLGQRAVLAWHELAVPVIAALHGHALGGGLQLALGADIRIAAPDATMSVFEINWGLTPDMAGTQLLPRLVGPDVAAELTWTGRLLDAEEADRIGLVTRVVDDPLAAAHELAARIAAANPEAVQTAKRLLERRTARSRRASPPSARRWARSWAVPTSARLPQRASRSGSRSSHDRVLGPPHGRYGDPQLRGGASWLTWCSSRPMRTASARSRSTGPTAATAGQRSWRTPTTARLTAAALDEAVRAVVVTGAGTTFCPEPI